MCEMTAVQTKLSSVGTESFSFSLRNLIQDSKTLIPHSACPSHHFRLFIEQILVLGRAQTYQILRKDFSASMDCWSWEPLYFPSRNVSSEEERVVGREINFYEQIQNRSLLMFQRCSDVFLFIIFFKLPFSMRKYLGWIANPFISDLMRCKCEVGAAFPGSVVVILDRLWAYIFL